MKKLLIAAGAVLAAGAFAPSQAQAACFVANGVTYCASTTVAGSAAAWSVIGCAASVVGSAAAANWRDNRELTNAEAHSCGVLYWFTGPNQEWRYSNARLMYGLYLANRAPKARRVKK